MYLCRNCGLPLTKYDQVFQEKIGKGKVLSPTGSSCFQCEKKMSKTKNRFQPSNRKSYKTHTVPIYYTLILSVLLLIMYLIDVHFHGRANIVLDYYDILMHVIAFAILLSPVLWIVCGYKTVKKFSLVKPSETSYRDVIEITHISGNKYQVEKKTESDSGEFYDDLYTAFLVITYVFWCVPHLLLVKLKDKKEEKSFLSNHPSYNQTYDEKFRNAYLATEKEVAAINIPTDRSQAVEINGEQFFLVESKKYTAGSEDYVLHFLLSNIDGVMVLNGYIVCTDTWISDWREKGVHPNEY